MKSQAVPSYHELFEDSSSYETLIAGLSKETVIIVCIALLNELNSNEDKYHLQRRIYDELAQTFPVKEKLALDKCLNIFWKKNDLEFGVLFHRSYLLEMILMELNSDRQDAPTSEINEEFNLFKAYIRVVTAVNQRQAQRNKLEPLKNIDSDQFQRTLKLLWRLTLSTYEFNELPHLPFELFKLKTFLKFASENYHAALGEYLTLTDQSSVGSLLASFSQISKTTLLKDPDARLKKLAYIAPDDHVSTVHLDKQSINLQNRDVFNILDIKMFPLYLTKKRGYMVIDPGFFMRKNYYGPFFELRTETSLKDTLNFNSYSSQVSQALEAKVFKPLISMACQHVPGKLKLDDGTANAPDGYFRIENLIFVMEYKASIFPQSLTQSIDYREITDFLDTKFVKSTDGQKGVSQLSQKLDVLSKGGYEDDRLNFTTKVKYRVYPIIVHHDFYFSLPGVNNYVRHKFINKLSEDERFDVMPLVVMNLSIIYDLVMADVDITALDRLFVNYYNFLKESTERLFLNEENKTNNFFASHMSFDEYFNQFILNQLPHPTDQRRKALNQELLDRAGISLDEFNQRYE